MKRTIFGFLLLCPIIGFSQLKYPSYTDIQSTVKSFQTKGLVSQTVIGKSYGNENIAVIKLQLDEKPRPTLLVVAGIDGKHPAGTVGTLQLSRNLLALPKDSLQTLLKDKSVWIVPLVNPDAYKRNSETSNWYSGNSRKVDNDRDGRIDEDPAKDLNGDGVIAQMRVESPIGNFVVHKEYSNVLAAADKSKAEKGKYNLFPEGADQDFDGRYGEDGEGGVNIDRNFTFNYQAFLPEGGDYAASEPETRALVDFIFANPQIASVLHIGLSNNLSEPEKFDARQAYERIVKSWSSNDVEVSKYISSIYKEETKSLGEATKFANSPGNFSNTAYYHLGKFSFATPMWWPSVTDSAKNVIKSTDANETFYKWVNQYNVQGAILPWTKVNHPDFPNQQVEVGGVVDIFRNNPPVELLESSVKAHTSFVVKLLENMAKLTFAAPKVTSLGNDVFRVELSVMNVGDMPTYPEIGDRIRFVSRFKTVCDLQNGQQFLSGKRLQLYPSLPVGGAQTFTWLIKGKGTVKIQAGCPTSGEELIEVKL
ncbi:M14 family metallopeptidase [Sphingobacterium cavernae]|uniref:M14 family metallopeptidase n=1 Tax=Sphingobacterium cavernae TaxID=2592657 RepID=UPI0012301A15|nr:M14 family metallopeptidase [Sphingobacterium cavernae]